MNRYHLIIIIRVILITLNSFVFVWFYVKFKSYPATTIFFFTLLVIQTCSLIYYTNKTNRDLSNFLISLQDNDTTLVFTHKKIEKNFHGLTDSLNKINLKIQQARIEKEQKHHYLQAVVDHIGIGLVSFNTNGEIEFINKTAKSLLGIHNIKNILSLMEKHSELIKYFSFENVNNQGLVKINVNNSEVPLSIKTGELRFNETKIKLVSFQNIKNELEEQELESWRKLIKILRHEIMNSITPITTLTAAIKRNLKFHSSRKPMEEINEENINDTLLSAEVIEERSIGLVSFVERFKKLTELPEPKYTLFYVEKLLENIKVLFSDELGSKNISFAIEVKEKNLQIKADEQLIEQVIINLVKNSIEAINEKDGRITIKTFRRSDGRFIIQVIDNGIGIKNEDLDNIFVPTFSTKDNGTGIGLSISKQIMQIHKGNISVTSLPGKETIFELIF